MGVGAERTTGEVDPASDFDLLYEQFRLQVYRAIRGIVLESPAAEDLTQETFERAYKGRREFRPGGSPGAWLHRIAVNLAISYLRRQRVARLVLPRLYVPHNAPHEQVEDRTLAVRALAALSPKLRAVVVLSFYARLTREEIARILKVPPGTVASRQNSAMEIMRRTLADPADPRKQEGS
jgi:RNA polymerase sigma-70 factor (ECF subfamily)